MIENKENKPAAAASPLPRLVPRKPDDRSMARVVGRRKLLLEDIYVRLIDAPWKKLVPFIAAAYAGVNVIFAGLYLLRPNSIINARHDSFADAFFFSVQTLATIGYGQMAPQGLYANLLVTIEAVLGFAFLAVVTGIVFAKFSRPTARVMFSNVAVICPYGGQPHLMLRLANERLNRIVNASVQAVMLIEERSDEGHRMRRFIDLPLVRSQVPFMLLTWTIMHRIDADSPLFGMTNQSLRDRSAELIISLTGLDESLAQTIHARFSYLSEEILFNVAFDDVITRLPDGQVEIHYDKFHDTHPAQALRPDGGRAVVPMAAVPGIAAAEALPLEQPADAEAVAAVARAEDDPAFAEYVKMCRPD